MENQLFVLEPEARWQSLSLDSGLELCVWPHHDTELIELLVDSLDTEAPQPALDEKAGADCKVFIIATDESGGMDLIYELRNDPVTRLSPVVAVHRGEVAPSKALAADRVSRLDATQLKTIILSLEESVSRILMLPFAEHVSASEQRELDLVRYFYTRQNDCVQAILDPRSRVGFRIPIVEAILGLSALDSLEAMEEYRALGYFEGQIEEQLYLCRPCKSVRLIFRETCPRCHMPGLEERSTIHHFRCAYVADRSEFVQGDELNCPKCDKTLRHVGVDHDFPEESLYCPRCDDSFSEGTVEVRCLECGEASTPERARQISLMSYQPTGALRRAAKMCQSPLLTNSKAMTLTLESVDPAVFRLLKEHTRTVANRYGREAKVIRIDTRGLYEHFDVAGHVEYRSLLVEIAKRLKVSTRIGDATAVTRDCTIEILLPETSQEQALVVLERIEAKILEIEDLSGHIGYAILDLTEKEASE